MSQTKTRLAKLAKRLPAQKPITYSVVRTPAEASGDLTVVTGIGEAPVGATIEPEEVNFGGIWPLDELHPRASKISRDRVLEAGAGIGAPDSEIGSSGRAARLESDRLLAIITRQADELAKHKTEDGNTDDLPPRRADEFEFCVPLVEPF